MFHDGTGMQKAVAMRAVTALVTALAISTASTATHTNPSTPTNHETSTRIEKSQSDLDELVDKLDRVPPGTPPERAAGILFPADPAAQRNYIDHARALEDAARDAGFASPRSRCWKECPARSGTSAATAIPAALAVFLPLLTKCVVSSFYGAVANELYIAAKNGDNFTVESLVSGAVGGCISGLLPPFLRTAANSVKTPLVEAITAAIIWLSRP